MRRLSCHVRSSELHSPQDALQKLCFLLLHCPQWFALRREHAQLVATEREHFQMHQLNCNVRTPQAYKKRTIGITIHFAGVLNCTTVFFNVQSWACRGYERV